MGWTASSAILEATHAMLNPSDAEDRDDATAVANAGQRRHVRHAVFWNATCLADGIAPFNATVIDASEGGFGLVGTMPALSVGNILYVDFDQIGAFRCQIVWMNKDRFGVAIRDGGNDSNSEPWSHLTAALLQAAHLETEMRARRRSGP